MKFKENFKFAVELKHATEMYFPGTLQIEADPANPYWGLLCLTRVWGIFLFGEKKGHGVEALIDAGDFFLFFSLAS